MQGRGHCSLKLKNVGDNEKLANKKQQAASRLETKQQAASSKREAGNEAASSKREAASRKQQAGSWKLEAGSVGRSKTGNGKSALLGHRRLQL